MFSVEEASPLLYEAAQNGQACRVSLEGEPFPRVIHPYGIARTSRNQIVVVCWQAMGLTKAGSGAGFRNLQLERIVEIEVLDEHFKKQEDFNPLDPQYAEWVFHI